MWKLLILTIVCLSFTGCMTPEQKAQANSLGDNMIGVGNGMRSQPQQQQNCTIVDMGGGVYNRTCN